MLPYATPSQNVYQRWHWSRRSRFRDEVQMIVRLQLRGRSPLPRIKTRMGVEITRMGARELDFGNLVGGCKPVIDALVREGLIYDDSPRWVQEDYVQKRVQKEEERTSIWVYPALSSSDWA